MRQFVAILLLIGWLSSTASNAFASGDGACSFLNRDLVKQVSGPVSEPLLDIILDQPPQEEPAGPGTACFYADIVLQIDAMSPEFVEQYGSSGQGGLTEVSGVGDRAYYRDNRGNYAEVIGVVGKRTYTVQLGVPQESNPEEMKHHAITLAKAIVAQLE